MPAEKPVTVLENMSETDSQEQRLEMGRRIGVVSDVGMAPIQSFVSIRCARPEGARWRLQFLNGAGEVLFVIEADEPAEILSHMGEVALRALVLPLCGEGEVIFGDG